MAPSASALQAGEFQADMVDVPEAREKIKPPYERTGGVRGRGIRSVFGGPGSLERNPAKCERFAERLRDNQKNLERDYV